MSPRPRGNPREPGPALLLPPPRPRLLEPAPPPAPRARSQPRLPIVGAAPPAPASAPGPPRPLSTKGRRVGPARAPAGGPGHRGAPGGAERRGGAGPGVIVPLAPSLGVTCHQHPGLRAPSPGAGGGAGRTRGAGPGRAGTEAPRPPRQTRFAAARDRRRFFPSSPEKLHGSPPEQQRPGDAKVAQHPEGAGERARRGRTTSAPDPR